MASTANSMISTTDGARRRGRRQQRSGRHRHRHQVTMNLLMIILLLATRVSAWLAITGTTTSTRAANLQQLLAVSSSSSSSSLPSETEVIDDDDDDDDDGSINKENIVFTTTSMPLYIEDTDAYGVMYNSNYLRSYDRALHMNMCSTKSTGSSATPIDSKRCILHDDNWSVISVDEIRYKQPIKLGQQFVIRGTLQDKDDDNEEEIWDMEMTSPPDDSSSSTTSTVYSTAKGVRIARIDSCYFPELFDDDSSSSNDGQKMLQSQDSFVTFRDEFEPHMMVMCSNSYDNDNNNNNDSTNGNNLLSLHRALNHFERARTNMLGGADCLQKLQQDDEIMYVVSKIESASLVTVVAQEEEDDDDDDDDTITSSFPPIPLVPGGFIHVETSCKVKKNGMIIDCYQTAYVQQQQQQQDESGNDNVPVPSSHHLRRRLIAQAIIQIVAVNAKTGKPTSKLPKWLVDNIICS